MLSPFYFAYMYMFRDDDLTLDNQTLSSSQEVTDFPSLNIH